MERALTVSISITSTCTVSTSYKYSYCTYSRYKSFKNTASMRSLRSIVPCLRITYNRVSSVFGKYTGSWFPFQNVLFHSGLHQEQRLSTPFYINSLLLQWTKSVTKLQGLIIMMKLDCKSTMGQATECLQAKVLGTWRSSGE